MEKPWLCVVFKSETMAFPRCASLLQNVKVELVQSNLLFKSKKSLYELSTKTFNFLLADTKITTISYISMLLTI